MFNFENNELRLAILNQHLEKQLQMADIKNSNLRRKNNFMQKSGTNFLKALKQSTLNFWYKFYTEKPSIPVSIVAFNEEVKEFLVEAENYNVNPTPENQLKLVEEAVDVLVTELMILSGADISIENIESAIIKVIEKNDAKNHETHAIDPVTGKITRKSKLKEMYGE